MGRPKNVQELKNIVGKFSLSTRINNEGTVSVEAGMGNANWLAKAPTELAWLKAMASEVEGRGCLTDYHFHFDEDRLLTDIEADAQKPSKEVAAKTDSQGLQFPDMPLDDWLERYDLEVFEYTCPKCGDKFKTTIPIITKEYAGVMTPVHGCGDQYIDLVITPTDLTGWLFYQLLPNGDSN